MSCCKPLYRVLSIDVTEDETTLTIDRALPTADTAAGFLGEEFCLRLVPNPNQYYGGAAATISITDGTTTVAVLNHDGQNLRGDSLYRYLNPCAGCASRNCYNCPKKRRHYCEVGLNCYYGIDPEQALVHDRMPRSLFVPPAAAAGG